MHVTVKLYGNLKRYAPNEKESESIEIENGTTIRGLLLRLGVPDARVWMSAINDQVVDDSSELHEGDTLEVFEPVGGGAFPRILSEATLAPHASAGVATFAMRCTLVPGA